MSNRHGFYGFGKFKKYVYGSGLIIATVTLLSVIHVFTDFYQSSGKAMDFSSVIYTSSRVLSRKDIWMNKRQELLSENGHKKKLMLFCYMRGGSTFFSELFRQNKEVMYWYEPYDAFYSSLFGEKTWHFPQDIFWHQYSPGNSTLRVQNDFELNEVARFNHNLLSCNFSGLPVELFYHLGLGKSNLGAFQNCIRSGSHNDPKNCRSGHIPQCTGNSKKVFQNRCPEYIQLAKAQLNSNETGKEVIPDSFTSFAKCNKKFETKITQCTHHLEKACKAARVVTYKGLRVTMRSVERMLQMDPDLHVVYYIRDPRGTVNSRVKISHTYRDTKNSPALEAKYLCAKMRADLKAYNRLKTEYPGSILLVKYEDVAKDPYTEVTRIYDFYGMCVHHSVYSWMKRNEEATDSGGVFSTARANSSASVDKWRSSYSLDVRQKMTDHCKDVLLTLNYTL